MTIDTTERMEQIYTFRQLDPAVSMLQTKKFKCFSIHKVYNNTNNNNNNNNENKRLTQPTPWWATTIGKYARVGTLRRQENDRNYTCIQSNYSYCTWKNAKLHPQSHEHSQRWLLEEFGRQWPPLSKRYNVIRK